MTVVDGWRIWFRVRCPDGGGLTAEGKARRETVRLQGAVARAGRAGWPLARVAELIARLFRQRYPLRGVSLLLHRIGFSPQVPQHRPVERDDAAIATWRPEVWPQAKQ